jgi:hypothetical protein
MVGDTAPTGHALTDRRVAPRASRWWGTSLAGSPAGGKPVPK